MESDKSLVNTIHATIRQGEKKSDTLVFIVPRYYSETNLSDCTVLLRYILPNGVGRSEELAMYPLPYNDDYYQYRLPVGSRFTMYSGDIELWLSVFDFNDGVVLQSDTAFVTIQAQKSIDNYLEPESLSQIDKLAVRVSSVVREMEQVSSDVGIKLDAMESTLSAKADNIVFNEGDNTIQLVANGKPVGQRIRVSTSDGKVVSDMYLSDDGELIVAYLDGTESNLGSAIGKDGAVYVPHISEQKVLTFTIEKEPGEIPEPVDLDPDDDWSDMDSVGTDMDGDGYTTDYVWDEIGDSDIGMEDFGGSSDSSGGVTDFTWEDMGNESGSDSNSGSGDNDGLTWDGV
jgi:hypothetical protein